MGCDSSLSSVPQTQTGPIVNSSSTNVVSRSWLLWIAMIGLCPAIVPGVSGSDPKEQASDDEKVKGTDSPNSERLELMRRRVSALTAEVETPHGPVKAELIPAPLLRF